MKITLIALAAFIGGTILGATAMLYKSQHDSLNALGSLAVGVTTDNAIYGTLLSEKRYDDLQRIIDNSILRSLDYQKHLSPPDAYRQSQKVVRGYFDFNGREVPAKIQEHIQSVPPGSGSEMLKFADTISEAIE